MLLIGQMLLQMYCRNIQVITDSMTLNTKADANPSTEKLSTIQEQSSMIMALITSRNKPNVIIVTGRASSLMMGLMKVLSSASTTATTIKVIMPEPEDTSGI